MSSHAHLYLARALLDVMRRPQYHSTRMAHWLQRAGRTSETRSAETLPLGAGRPPGGSKHRFDKRPEAQAALRLLDNLVRGSLAFGASP